MKFKKDQLTLNIKLQNGGRFTGILTIKNYRIYFQSLFDISFSGRIVEDLSAKFGDDGFIIIPKNQIKWIESKTSLWSGSYDKQCIPFC